MSYELRQELRQELKLTQKLLQECRLHIYALRMNLIGVLRDEQYEPKGRCPQCNKNMTPAEIIAGFNNDPNDFTTQCPECECRFAPSIICFGNGTSVTLPFYCDIQTMEQLRGKESLSPAEIAQRYPAIYRSAIAHCGGLAQAFAAIGIDYPHKEELSGWKNKVRPFLGRMTDKMIAEVVRVSPATIRKMRKELDIPRFTMTVAAEEIS